MKKLIFFVLVFCGSSCFAAVGNNLDPAFSQLSQSLERLALVRAELAMIKKELSFPNALCAVAFSRALDLISQQATKDLRSGSFMAEDKQFHNRNMRLLLQFLVVPVSIPSLLPNWLRMGSLTLGFGGIMWNVNELCKIKGLERESQARSVKGLTLSNVNIFDRQIHSKDRCGHCRADVAELIEGNKKAYQYACCGQLICADDIDEIIAFCASLPDGALENKAHCIMCNHRPVVLREFDLMTLKPVDKNRFVLLLKK